MLMIKTQDYLSYSFPANTTSSTEGAREKKYKSILRLINGKLQECMTPE
jgi:hypothetical protein